MELEPMPARDIQWPPELHPAIVPVFTHNEIYIPADAEKVWTCLVRAEDWPGMYPRCRNLRFCDEDHGPDLTGETELVWSSFGRQVSATIAEFHPPYRLAWHGTTLGAHGYHGWVIDPVDDGCRVITQSAVGGLSPSLFRIPTRRLLRRGYQRWLEGLAKAVGEHDTVDAETAFPEPVQE